MCAALALGALALAAAAVVPVGAGVFEAIHDYDVHIEITDDGAIVVRETIDYDFGSVARHGIYRDVPVRFDYPERADTDRVYRLEVLGVRTSPGAPDQYVVEDVTTNGIGYERIKIGDPDRTITGEHTYVITYRVEGALNGFDDHDELVWNAVGTEWLVTIDGVDVVVESPAPIPRVLCTQGPFGSNLPCDAAEVEGATARFAQAQLFPFNGLTVSIEIPPGAVPVPPPILEERWTIEAAFTVNAVTGGVAGGLFLVLVGLFGARFWRVARDRRYRGSAVDQAHGGDDADVEVTPLLDGPTETPVEFVPPDDLRPGQIGTLVDFRANPLDVTATIVDLAVRKYLTIEEVPIESRWLKQDWRLTRTKKSDTSLLAYERLLLEGLFRSGDEVELSDLKNKFAARMRQVRDALVDDAMERKWFRSRPDHAGTPYVWIGGVIAVVGAFVTWLLAGMTHAALLGLPVIAFGLLVIAASTFAPARTAKGSAVLRRVHGFRRFIEESEKERARLAERKQLFSEYLPYAIVFGATEQWARAFAGLDGEPLDTSSWYRSTTPFEYGSFSHAIGGMTVATAGTLSSTPASTSGSSGFSGGGSSGGGGGGGGGGSW